jgi:replicative DNA helicase
MSREELIARGVSRAGAINSKVLEGGEEAVKQQEERIEATVGSYFSQVAPNLYIIEGGSDTTPAKIHSQIASVRAQRQLQSDAPLLVVVDYIQLLSTGIDLIDLGPNETAKVTELAWKLKVLARDNNVALLGISDVTKEEQSNYTKDRGLTFNALRGSNRLGHSADCVLFLYSEQSMAGEGKAESDPWEYCARSFQAANHNDPRLELLEKARRKYPLGGAPSTAYARLEIFKNRRGRRGVQIPLVYEKAYHRFSPALSEVRDVC